MTDRFLLISGVLMPVAVSLVQIGAIFVIKLPNKIQDFQRMIGETQGDVDALEARVSKMSEGLEQMKALAERRAIVIQRILSDWIGTPVDIDAIGEDWRHYPTLPTRPRRT